MREVEAKGLKLTVKMGEGAILTLPDGRKVTVIVAGWDIYSRKHIKLAFDAPQDVRISRDTEKTRQKGGEDPNPTNSPDLKRLANCPGCNSTHVGRNRYGVICLDCGWSCKLEEEAVCIAEYKARRPK